jgi:predicted nucleic acid-binding protein
VAALTPYVADTSIVAKYLLTEPDTPLARALFAECFVTVELHVPDQCLTECANILWGEVVFRGGAQSDAVGLLTNVRTLLKVRRVTPPLLLEALEIAVRQRITVYDAIFVALAVRLKCPLITADVKQAGAAQAEGVVLKTLMDFAPAP